MTKVLTMYDINLVPYYKLQFELVKLLYFTFTEDQALKNELQYNPEPPRNKNDIEWEKMVRLNPTVSKRQGIFFGNLDKMVDALIKEQREKPEIMTFGEFQDHFYTNRKSDKMFTRKFHDILYMFINFHPQTMPILWRILLTQAHIYLALKNASTLDKTMSSFSVYVL
jgi:hypothetical protein